MADRRSSRAEQYGNDNRSGISRRGYDGNNNEHGDERRQRRSRSRSWPRRSRSPPPRRREPYSRSRSRSRTRGKRDGDDDDKERHHRARSRSKHREKRRRSYSRSRSSSRSRSGSRERRRRKHRSRSRSSSSSTSSSHHKSRRRKEKHRKRSRSRDRDRERRKKEKKKEKKEKKRKLASGSEWGKYGIINESNMYEKDEEFRTWLVEERMINPETISKDATKREFARFAEDYNTATLPHEKYYNISAYTTRMSLLRSGEALPGTDIPYDPEADLAAHKKHLSSTTKTSSTTGAESYLSREQLQELRKVQMERNQVGKMKVMGMDIKQNFGVRMDGSSFDD